MPENRRNEEESRVTFSTIVLYIVILIVVAVVGRLAIEAYLSNSILLTEPPLQQGTSQMVMLLLV